MATLLSQSLKGELTTQKPKTLQRVPKLNFIDELMDFLSIRTGDDLDFTKKSIMNLLEHEFCKNECSSLISKVQQNRIELPFKNNSNSRHSTLHYLCQVGDIASVKLLLDQGVDFNILDYDGCSPSFYALSKAITTDNSSSDSESASEETFSHLFSLLQTQNFPPRSPAKYILPLYLLTIKRDSVKDFELLYRAGLTDFEEYKTYDGMGVAHLCHRYQANNILDWLKVEDCEGVGQRNCSNNLSSREKTHQEDYGGNGRLDMMSLDARGKTPLDYAINNQDME